MGFLPAEHIASMQQVDARYWWYAVRRGWISTAVRQAQGEFGAVRMVDFGCGPGGLLQSLAAEHPLAEVLGVDGDARMVDAVRARGLPAQLVDLQASFDLAFRPNLWVCADVLEHLEDDRAALERMRAAGAPGALLAITVPAHQWLFSDWDTRNGHHRRYARAGMGRLLEAAGWEPLRLRYFFSFLIPPVLWKRKLGRREESLEFPAVAPWLNRVLTLAGRIERLAPFSPVGTSLFCVARARA